MNLFVRLSALWLVLISVSTGLAQTAGKIARIEIKHVGPQAVSDELIRANIRVKPGDVYQRLAADDDVRNLYATGFFSNIQIGEERTSDGIVLSYVVQGKPRLTEIKFKGNKKYSDSKLRKKISSKVGEPLDERKLFTDTQEILKQYQKAGYPRTEVKYVQVVDENAGRGTATFEINESPKVKIGLVEFVGAKAFKESKLRKQIKTRKHWMFSWLTGSGTLKEEQFEEDKEKLATFYRDNGYIDFEIKDVKFLYPTPKKMTVQFIVYEGTQYKVGSIKFTGNQIFNLSRMTNGLRRVQYMKGGKVKFGANGLPMDVGDVFSPKGLSKDLETVEDFYGAAGYIDVGGSSRNLNVVKIPNVETGTMDLEFRLEEGQKYKIEKIEIRGNTKTKDKVIRRELAVAPGETFDMVRVKLSKQRLEGLQYFEKVDARPESTDVAGGKNLVIGVDEKNTGNLTVGAGFSSVDSVVGFAEITQGNFDLFNPPTFTGAGQKFRLRVQIGTERQDYEISFIEPWFLGRKLSLGVDLYYRDLNFQSVNNIYDEIRAGGRVSLTRALWTENIIGMVSITPEDIGIRLNSPYHGPIRVRGQDPGSPYGYPTGPGNGGGPPFLIPANVPPSILQEVGYNFLTRFGGSLAYDTRNGVQLPDRGQRTELLGQVAIGDRQFYKMELTSAWYFRGFAKGHVLELLGRTGVADTLEDVDVPFYDRYYLGGMYSLRGFQYRGISPRELGFSEPVGGDTFWFGSAEYSIPIIERLRFALFYDIGNVLADPYDYKFSGFSDNWGVGLRLNLPIGPLRLDYGIPINHDRYNGSSGRFQFGVGFTRGY